MCNYKMNEAMTTSSSFSSPYESRVNDLLHLDSASAIKKNSKKIFSRQLSMSETKRDLAWEQKRQQMLIQERKREETIANPNDLCDHDLNELKGCIELGFGFDEEKGGQNLTKSLPALDFYFAVNRIGSPTMSPRCVSSSGSKLSGFGSSSSKSLDEERSSSVSSEDSWKICNPGEDPQQVKTKLRQWAQVVACSVMLSA
uniref:uncharacterized protein LOC122583352 n=1 Tax=Erigeron canadensis TaxID=72917 RepID=UPI001CB9980E|nr:uncharacterized protein LOC122583352 [Erigeron canadensis]